MEDMMAYQGIIKSIIQAQMNIIGPMAIEEANKVIGLSVGPNCDTISITIEPSQAIEALVSQYAQLFGSISIEVSKDAIRSALKSSDKKVTLPGLVS